VSYLLILREDNQKTRIGLSGNNDIFASERDKHIKITIWTENVL
jgi:hypothetical protein